MRRVASLEMLQNATDDRRVFDAGDDRDRAGAVFAALDVDVELTFESLRPRHGGAPRGGSADLDVGCASAAAARRGDLCAQCAVRREYAVIANEVDARLGDERGEA